MGKDIQRQNDKGQEGGTSKQKNVSSHKGEQGHAKTQIAERKKEDHPSSKLLETTRVSKDIPKPNDGGQQGGTSKQKTIRHHKGEQGHPKAKWQRARGMNIQAENG